MSWKKLSQKQQQLLSIAAVVFLLLLVFTVSVGFFTWKARRDNFGLEKIVSIFDGKEEEVEPTLEPSPTLEPTPELSPTLAPTATPTATPKPTPQPTAAPTSAPAEPTNPPEPPKQTSHEYFWREGCPYCDQVSSFLETWDKKDQIAIDKKNTTSSGNAALLQQRAASCGLTQYGVPFLYTLDGQCIIGSEAIINYLQSL